MLLVQRVYKCLAHHKPYLVHHAKLAAQPITRLSTASNALHRWDLSYIVLVDLGAPCSLPRLPFVSGGFWAVIFSQAMWKRSWVGHDPAQSKMATDRIVATTGKAAWAQLLTA